MVVSISNHEQEQGLNMKANQFCNLVTWSSILALCMWGFTMANWLSYMTGSQGIGWTSSVLWDSSFAQLSTTVNSFILFWFCSLSDLKRNDAKYWDWLVWKILVEWSGVVDLSFSFGWRLCSSFLCFCPFSSSFLVWFRKSLKKDFFLFFTFLTIFFSPCVPLFPISGFVEQPAASWQSFSCYCQAYDSNSVLEFNEWNWPPSGTADNKMSIWSWWTINQYPIYQQEYKMVDYLDYLTKWKGCFIYCVPRFLGSIGCKSLFTTCDQCMFMH